MWTHKNTALKRLNEDELRAYEKETRERQPVGRLLQQLATITFSDGSNDITVSTWISDPETELPTTINSNLDRLNKQARAEQAIADGTFDPTKKPEPTPEPELTDEQKAEQAWSEQFIALKQAEIAIDELTNQGIEPTQEEKDDYDALKTWVATNRKKEYSRLIPGLIKQANA